jgi:hypothetical protein
VASEDFDRRTLIRRASLGAAATGALTIVGGGLFSGTASASAAPAKAEHKPTDLLDGHDVLVHVLDARTGEISVLHGTREIKFIDRDLAQQLTRITK